ncbi:hypothetical protein [Streptomyces platensis]|uniref:hypothetical protein n=1 Tax=Streptomyces platensis TaxID=58346 RepID=UPI00386CAA6D|nr:hypothetical protein OG962_12115 [Streptomyces platensis]
MRGVSRSLALAVTTVAVAGITFAGVAPAGAVSAGAAATSGRNCEKEYLTPARKAERQTDEYQLAIAKEQAKAHPDTVKIRRYDAMASESARKASVLREEYKRCTNS